MTRLRLAAIALSFAGLAALAGCSTTGGRAGGYYKDDGPGANPPDNVASTPDAVPRIETYHKGTGKPYTVSGERYVPVKPDHPFEQRGIASWYGRKFNGHKTASGEKYNMYAMTAAHPTLPIPSYARVTRVSTGKSIIVRINDRGPFHSNRIIDLSYAAAAKLGLIHKGKGEVIVQAITNDDIRQGDYLRLADGDSAGQASAPGAAEASGAAQVDSDPPKGSVSDFHPIDVAVANTAAAQSPAPAAESDSGGQPPSGGDIYLQFGAFKAEENARHLAQKLNQAISQADGRAVQVMPGASLYRVQLGPYPDRTAAVNAAWRIRQATGTASTIVAARRSAGN